MAEVKRASRWRLSRVNGLLLFGALAFVLLWSVFQFGERYFLQRTAERGQAALRLHVENLRGWLGRYQALPHIYARSPEIQSLLKIPDDPAWRERANRFLVAANFSTGAADSYVLDLNGVAVAASNWAEDTSFVGRDYSYRPYFHEALQGRLGRFFALGTASGQRGYYFARPVRDGHDIIGVVVVKAGVDSIEEDLRRSVHEVLVSGPEGIVHLAGHPQWRLKAMRPLDAPALARITRQRQFDDESFELLDWREWASSVIGIPVVEALPDRSDGRAREFLVLTEKMPVEGWNAHLLIETGSALRQTAIAVGIAGIGLLAFGLLLAVVRERRRRFEDLLTVEEKARERLEQAVAQRTQELSMANRQLEDEVGERKAAEDELRRMQNELVQAGKLAALGQMSAALSHEFNQPLTAIRTYAENALAFLDRGREEEAQGNMRLVSKLTERMAALSKHLSSFARKPQEALRPVSLTAALTETLDLLKGRLENADLTLRLDLPQGEVWVVGGHVRLQQVIMNLVTNAIDAMRKVGDPLLAVSVAATPTEVLLTVEDNGCGISPEAAAQIFDPFFTTKGVGEGLGLGLSISYNIIKDFGGSITAASRPEGGTRMIVHLTPAEAAGGLAAQ